MNYKESSEILREIKKSNKILLNCHRGPDPDSLGSNLAMKIVLEGMGKDVDIICPTKNISKQTDFLEGFEDLQLGINFENFDFSNYDLFISIDTPNLSLMTGNENSIAPEVRTIVIDHHYISTLEGFIKLIDIKATSMGEMLFSIFEDWKIQLNKNISECLLTSIIGDTGAFAYPNVTSKTLKAAALLMENGANKNMIADKIYRNESFEMLKFWSEVLSDMQIDKEFKFVWAMIPYEVYKKYEHLENAKAKSASLFGPIVEGTDFGFIGIEEKPHTFSISFRGRTTFDTSQIVKALGGGGHKASSAVKISGLDYDSAVIKVLETARKYAKKG